MQEKETKASIAGMRERYGDFALSQYNAIMAGIDHASQQLVERLEVDTLISAPIVKIVDLGAADGINSFPVVKQFAQTLMKKCHSLQLLVSHIELPSADLEGLSFNIHEHQSSYKRTLDNNNIPIQSFVVPQSFYNSFLPPQSVDILFSTTALHYASQKASIITDHVLPLRAKKVEEFLAWEQLSESDLERALMNIHECLKPGGKFWAVVPAHSLNESSGEIKNYWYREVLDIMSEQLQLLVNKGIIETETWNHFVLPTHQRHLSQWQTWFFKNKSLFHLDFLYTQEQMNPYLERFHKEHKDPIRFADEYLSSVRAWGEKIITQLLPDQNQRNEFFELLRLQFIKEPSRFENDTLSLYVGATRL